MSRWGAAVLALAVIIVWVGLVALNPTAAPVRWWPGRQVEPPLGVALLAAFAAGLGLAGIAGALRATRRALGRWRATRAERPRKRTAERLARAERLLWRGEPARARAALGAAAAEEAAGVLACAQSYLDEGRPGEARQVLEEGLVRLGADARLLGLLARAAEEMGDDRGATDALERARILEPGSPALARRLRDAYVRSARWDRALELQEEIVTAARGTPRLEQERALRRGIALEAALASPDGRGARKQIAAVLRESPEFLPARVALGDLLLQEGRAGAALRVWENGLEQWPAAVLLERLERAHLARGQAQRVDRLYRKLARSSAASDAVRVLHARFLLSQGNVDGAAKALEGVSREGHNTAPYQALEAEVHRRQGHLDVAAGAYQRALGSSLGVISPYCCTVCRRESAQWVRYCPGCRSWDTYRAAVERACPWGRRDN